MTIYSWFTHEENDLPIKHGDFFHSDVSLPGGMFTAMDTDQLKTMDVKDLRMEKTYKIRSWTGQHGSCVCVCLAS